MKMRENLGISLADGSIPYHKHHAQFMSGVGWGAGSYRLFGFPGV